MSHLIIGNGAAGFTAAKEIKMGLPSAEVTIVTHESHPAFYRPLLPKLLQRDVRPNDFFLKKEAAAPGVQVRTGEVVTGIDPLKKTVSFESGEKLRFEKLLLATGSSPIHLELPGMDGSGVYTLRTIEDAEKIMQAAREARRAVIIGGGRVGMRTAAALTDLGLKVTVVERLERLVPLQLDVTASSILERCLTAQGIEFVPGQTVKEIIRSGKRIKAVVLKDNREIEADFVVQAVGVRPNLDLAKDAELEVNEGVLVNKYLQTSNPDIFASGDVVETNEVVSDKKVVSGLWTNAVQMGRISGKNMIGEKREYEGAFSVLNSLEIGGTPTISVGVVNPPDGSEHKTYTRHIGDRYRKLVFKNGILIGALLLGDIKGAGVYTGLIKRKADIEHRLDLLMNNQPQYAPWLVSKK